MKSIRIERALKKIGAGLKAARLRRSISMEEMAQRLDTTRQTLSRMEKGVSGTAVEKYLTSFMIFDKLDGFENLLEDDKTGVFIMEENKLPQRIRKKKNGK
jgi:transcriptional regulator with XRE-family HTH domain